MSNVDNVPSTSINPITTYDSRVFNSDVISYLNVNSEGDVVTAYVWNALWTSFLNFTVHIDLHLKELIGEDGVIHRLIIDHNFFKAEYIKLKADHDLILSKLDIIDSNIASTNNMLTRAETALEDTINILDALGNGLVHVGNSEPENPEIRLWIRPSDLADIPATLEDVDLRVHKVRGNGHTYQVYAVGTSDNMYNDTTLAVEDNDLFEHINDYGTIPRRQLNGNLLTNTPVKDLDCANKKYVDDAVANAGGGGSIVTPDWNQNDPSQPDYVKNRTHYSSKAFDDITWDGDETGHEVVMPWDENERLVKVSASGFEVNDLIGATIYLTDGTVKEITTDTSFDILQGGYIIGYQILVVNSAEELNNAFDVPNGTFSKGIYFISAYGNPVVTKLSLPETVKKLDEKYLPELAPVAKTGMYKDLLNTPTVDQNYRSTSENAQSGKAVKQAIDTCIPRPKGAPEMNVEVLVASNFDNKGNPIYFGLRTLDIYAITGFAIPSRQGNGNLTTNTPELDIDCANKKYVDDAVANASGGSSDTYTKDEIDNMVGDIETLLGGI